MFDEFRYRWKLRRMLKAHAEIRKSHESVATMAERAEDEPDLERAVGKELTIQEQEIAVFRSDYLVEQAYLYHVPVPYDDGSWLTARYAGHKRYLTPEAATSVRAKIREEKKASWEYWQTRVTFALAIIGSIFGVLAFFKK